MKDSKEFINVRPSKNIQLLVLPKSTDYIIDDPKEYLKDKYRIENFY